MEPEITPEVEAEMLEDAGLEDLDFNLPPCNASNPEECESCT